MNGKTKRVFCLMVGLAAGMACADIAKPEVSGWFGTAYREGGWFTYQMKDAYADGSLKFESGGPFVLSPRFGAPIRKVALKVTCKSDSPTRFLRLAPFAAGVEGDPVLAWDAAATTGVPKDVETSVVLDFATSDRIDAFRLYLDSSGKGNWSLSAVCVFYGAHTAEEDEELRSFATMLPTPENLRVDDFSSTSLALRADAVENAVGYRFRLDRLEGYPRTTVREDFIGGETLSDGWSYGEVANVTLGKYTGTSSSSYPDTKTCSPDDVGGNALKIEIGKDDGPVRVEILSPFTPADIVECSFFSKCASTPTSDAIEIWGRTDATAAWVSIGETLSVTNAKTWTTNAVATAAHIRQVKFVFASDKTNGKNCALDTLCVVYGGDETRTVVADGTDVRAEPTLSVSGLATGRYVSRVQAVGGDGFRDSSWSDELTWDLAWAEATVTAPANVRTEIVGGKPTVNWDAVAGADHYLVTVKTAGYPSETLVDARVAAGTSLALDDLTGLGEYEIVVTAVSPGGKSSAVSEPVAFQLELGKVEGVTAVAADRETIGVSWPGVPFAEGYLMTIYALEGKTSRVESDYSRFPDDWPEGWTHHDEWTAQNGCFYKNGEMWMPKFVFRNAWFATGVCPDVVTRISYSVKSGSSVADILAAQTLCVDGTADLAGETGWETISTVIPTTSLTQQLVDVSASRGIRRIRFRVAYARDVGTPNIQLDRFTITCGETERRLMRTVRTTKTSETVGGLSCDGTYLVRVTPLPGESETLAAESEPVDMSTMKPRVVAPVSLRSHKEDKCYEESFSSLSSIKAGIDVKDLDLAHWQFRSAGAEPQRLAYTSTCGSTACGVFIVSDTNRTAGSYMLATHANGTSGAMVGLAFTNDSTFAAVEIELSFDSVQRSFQKDPKTQVVEYLVTDGATDIDTNGEWTPLEIDTVAPVTKTTMTEGQTECRTAQGPIALDGVKVSPGKVLLVRWRDEAQASSPMMGVDNVRLTFETLYEAAFRVILR